MAGLQSLLIPPILLLISLPLACLAALTSIFAFSTLAVRALIVYVELAVALLQNRFVLRRSEHTSTKSPAKSRRRPKSREARHESHRIGLGAYGAGNPTRDYEGIGGWRDTDPDAESLQWMQMNDRLQLPARPGSRRRHHQRSRTSSSLVGLPRASPSSRSVTPTKHFSADCFAHGKMSRSAISLDTASTSRVL